MRLTIFNVGHGFCAYLVGDTNSQGRGNVALFDCGHDDAVGFRPSRDLISMGCSGIEHLVISHYDQDHLSDLPNLRAASRELPVRTLYRNKSLTPDQIKQVKEAGGPLEPGVEAVIELTREYCYEVTTEDREERELAGVEFAFFSNPYPTFQDTNNLSLVTFVHHRSVSLVFPGDLETAGWRMLLVNPEFRQHLQRVDVFIASHHGRSNGYAAEVFDVCTPDIVIISDTKKQYSTQEQRYDQHARGILWDGGPSRRCTLCTRSDGHIQLVTKAEGGYHISTHHQLPSRR
jgi:beta-lactamase superfamily II metal-dependent hydrolase